jgi:hypothetical protein
MAGIASEHPVRVWPYDHVGAAAADEAVRYAVGARADLADASANASAASAMEGIAPESAPK